jgi:oligoendopeptidase F
LSKHFIGVTNSIIKNKNKINVYLRNKELNDYQRAYDLIFKDKPHILSDENNKAINKISINNSAVGSIFSTLEQDIKFEDALDSKNKPHKLITNTDVVKNLKNKDRVLRKNS